MIPDIWLMRSALAYRLTDTSKGKTSRSNTVGPRASMIVFLRLQRNSFAAGSRCWLRRGRLKPPHPRYQSYSRPEVTPSKWGWSQALADRGERYRHQPADYRAGGKAAQYTSRTGAACRRGPSAGAQCDVLRRHVPRRHEGHRPSPCTCAGQVACPSPEDLLPAKTLQIFRSY